MLKSPMDAREASFLAIRQACGRNLIGLTRLSVVSLVLMSPVQALTAGESFLLPYDQAVTRSELKYYLKERLVPEAIESAVAKPDALKNAIVNLYVMKRASSIAESEALVSPGELEYRRGDGGRRLVFKRSSQIEAPRYWVRRTGLHLQTSAIWLSRPSWVSGYRLTLITYW